jgi:hypothetical protein
MDGLSVMVLNFNFEPIMNLFLGACVYNKCGTSLTQKGADAGFFCYLKKYIVSRQIKEDGRYRMEITTTKRKFLGGQKPPRNIGKPPRKFFLAVHRQA